MGNELDRKALDEWSRDVIRWTQEKVEAGHFDEVYAKLEAIITALIVATRKEYRNDVLNLIKTLIETINKMSGG